MSGMSCPKAGSVLDMQVWNFEPCSGTADHCPSKAEKTFAKRLSEAFAATCSRLAELLVFPSKVPHHNITAPYAAIVQEGGITPQMRGWHTHEPEPKSNALAWLQTKTEANPASKWPLGRAMYIVTTLFSCTRLWKTVPSQRFDKKLTIYANTLRHGVPDTNSELVEQLLLSITTKNP